VVGEISLFIGGDGPAFVRAAEPSTLLRFPYAGFRQLMDGDCLPAFRVLYNLAQLLARRLRAADAQLAEMCDPQTPPPAEDDLDRLRRIFFTDWAF
jgi:CRP-like cAMP-binding protein